MSIKKEIEKQVRLIILYTMEACYCRTRTEISAKLELVQNAEQEIYKIIDRLEKTK